jgi:hypothetical protein
MGAAITAGCGVLLDLSHLDDGTSGTGTGTSTGTGSGGAPATSSASSSAGQTSATATSSAVGTSTSSGTGGSGGGSGGGDAGMPLAPSVEIVGPDGGPNFKIAEYEVTAGDYHAFVKAFETAPTKQPDVCWWNHAVRPNTVVNDDAGIATAPECASYDIDTEASLRPNQPVRCIDWCDANAYCIWAGGYMCHGNEGKNEYPVEWRTACATSVGLKFPYGQSFIPNQCLDSTSSPTGPVDVGKKTQCEGGSKKMFDMSGNVAEWIDCGCEFDQADSTKTDAFYAGGSFKLSGDTVSCGDKRTAPLVSFHEDIGARCCYPVPDAGP